MRQREQNNLMKAEVAKRREIDPSFTFRKLKDELFKRNTDMTGSLNNNSYTSETQTSMHSPPLGEGSSRSVIA
jgi:hypothetical protein